MTKNKRKLNSSNANSSAAKKRDNKFGPIDFSQLWQSSASTFVDEHDTQADVDSEDAMDVDQPKAESPQSSPNPNQRIIKRYLIHQKTANFLISS